ncbi:titin-like isoform X3 [Armigeres subalbatus]
MRPPMGAGSHQSTKSANSMGFIMPLYTIGIVSFFIYTILKLIFKKTPATPYPEIKPDTTFRNEVFTAPDQPYIKRPDSGTTKLGQPIANGENGAPVSVGPVSNGSASASFNHSVQAEISVDYQQLVTKSESPPATTDSRTTAEEPVTEHTGPVEQGNDEASSVTEATNDKEQVQPEYDPAIEKLVDGIVVQKVVQLNEEASTSENIERVASEVVEEVLQEAESEINEAAEAAAVKLVEKVVEQAEAAVLAVEIPEVLETHEEESTSPNATYISKEDQSITSVEEPVSVPESVQSVEVTHETVEHVEPASEQGTDTSKAVTFAETIAVNISNELTETQPDKIDTTIVDGSVDIEVKGIEEQISVQNNVVEVVSNDTILVQNLSGSVVEPEIAENIISTEQNNISSIYEKADFVSLNNTVDKLQENVIPAEVEITQQISITEPANAIEQFIASEKSVSYKFDEPILPQITESKVEQEDNTIEIPVSDEATAEEVVEVLKSVAFADDVVQTILETDQKATDVATELVQETIVDSKPSETIPIEQTALVADATNIVTEAETALEAIVNAEKVKDTIKGVTFDDEVIVVDAPISAEVETITDTLVDAEEATIKALAEAIDQEAEDIGAVAEGLVNEVLDEIQEIVNEKEVLEPTQAPSYDPVTQVLVSSSDNEAVVESEPKYSEEKTNESSDSFENETSFTVEVDAEEAVIKALAAKMEEAISQQAEEAEVVATAEELVNEVLDQAQEIAKEKGALEHVEAASHDPAIQKQVDDALIDGFAYDADDKNNSSEQSSAEEVVESISIKEVNSELNSAPSQQTIISENDVVQPAESVNLLVEPTSEKIVDNAVEVAESVLPLVSEVNTTVIQNNFSDENDIQIEKENSIGNAGQLVTVDQSIIIETPLSNEPSKDVKLETGLTTETSVDPIKEEKSYAELSDSEAEKIGENSSFQENIISPVDIVEKDLPVAEIVEVVLEGAAASDAPDVVEDQSIIISDTTTSVSEASENDTPQAQQKDIPIIGEIQEKEPLVEPSAFVQVESVNDNVGYVEKKVSEVVEEVKQIVQEDNANTSENEVEQVIESVEAADVIDSKLVGSKVEHEDEAQTTETVKPDALTIENQIENTPSEDIETVHVLKESQFNETIPTANIQTEKVESSVEVEPSNETTKEVVFEQTFVKDVSAEVYQEVLGAGDDTTLEKTAATEDANTTNEVIETALVQKDSQSNETAPTENIQTEKAEAIVEVQPNINIVVEDISETQSSVEDGLEKVLLKVENDAITETTTTADQRENATNVVSETVSQPKDLKVTDTVPAENIQTEKIEAIVEVQPSIKITEEVSSENPSPGTDESEVVVNQVVLDTEHTSTTEGITALKEKIVVLDTEHTSTTEGITDLKELQSDDAIPTENIQSKTVQAIVDVEPIVDSTLQEKVSEKPSPVEIESANVQSVLDAENNTTTEAPTTAEGQIENTTNEVSETVPEPKESKSNEPVENILKEKTELIVEVETNIKAATEALPQQDAAGVESEQSHTDQTIDLLVETETKNDTLESGDIDSKKLVNETVSLEDALVQPVEAKEIAGEKVTLLDEKIENASPNSDATVETVEEHVPEVTVSTTNEQEEPAGVVPEKNIITETLHSVNSIEPVILSSADASVEVVSISEARGHSEEPTCEPSEAESSARGPIIEEVLDEAVEASEEVVTAIQGLISAADEQLLKIDSIKKSARNLSKETEEKDNTETDEKIPEQNGHVCKSVDDRNTVESSELQQQEEVDDGEPQLEQVDDEEKVQQQLEVEEDAPKIEQRHETGAVPKKREASEDRSSLKVIPMEKKAAYDPGQPNRPGTPVQCITLDPTIIEADVAESKCILLDAAKVPQPSKVTIPESELAIATLDSSQKSSEETPFDLNLVVVFESLSNLNQGRSLEVNVLLGSEPTTPVIQPSAAARVASPTREVVLSGMMKLSLVKLDDNENQASGDVVLRAKDLKKGDRYDGDFGPNEE